MSMEIKVTQTNREEEVKAKIRVKFAQGLHDCEKIILPAAKAIAPEISGRYKKSLGYAVDEMKLEAALYSGGKPAPHAHFVEWGSHKMAPHGTMRKAAEASRTAMGDAIAKRCEEPV